MKKFIPFSCAAIVVSSLLPSCSTESPASLPAVEKTVEQPADLSSAKVPALRSAWLDRNWGAPEVRIDDDGGYRLRYRQGTTLNFVFIYGLVRAEPVPAKPKDWEEETHDPGELPGLRYHKQSWRTVSVLGKSVKWYQNDGGSGADFPCYKTVDFALTAPDGRKGFYRIEVCATTAAEAATLMRKASW
ncbi:MAG: hypothetical protein QM680_08490 [Luteolibacter sp.]